jgi:hypothetical protein
VICPASAGLFFGAPGMAHVLDVEVLYTPDTRSVSERQEFAFVRSASLVKAKLVCDKTTAPSRDLSFMHSDHFTGSFQAEAWSPSVNVPLASALVIQSMQATARRVHLSSARRGVERRKNQSQPRQMLGLNLVAAPRPQKNRFKPLCRDGFACSVARAVGDVARGAPSVPWQRYALEVRCNAAPSGRLSGALYPRLRRNRRYAHPHRRSIGRSRFLSAALVRYRVASLDGRVGTEADRQRAEQLALEVQGVESVVPLSGSASK